MSNSEDKKIAYKGLALCYCEQKSYVVSVKCFKKLLEVAWDTNDVEAEV